MAHEPTYLELLTASIIETRKMKSDIRSFISAMESIFQDLVTVELELCNLYERAADLDDSNSTKPEETFTPAKVYGTCPHRLY